MINDFISQQIEDDDLNDNGALLNINVRLSSNQNATLTIFENDIIEDKVEAFCKHYKLNKQIKEMLTHQVMTQLDSQITELEESERQSESESGHNQSFNNDNDIIKDLNQYHQSFGSFRNIKPEEGKNNTLKTLNSTNQIDTYLKGDESPFQPVVTEIIYNEPIPKTIINIPISKDNRMSPPKIQLSSSDHHYNNKDNKNPINVNKTTSQLNTLKTIQIVKDDYLKTFSKTTLSNGKINKEKQKDLSQSKINITSPAVSKSKSKSKPHEKSNKLPKKTDNNIKPMQKKIIIPNVKRINNDQKSQKSECLSPQKEKIHQSPIQKNIYPKKEEKSMTKSKSFRTPNKSQDHKKKVKKGDDDIFTEKSLEIFKIKYLKYQEIFNLLDSDKDGYISITHIKIADVDKDLLVACTPLFEDLQKTGAQMAFKEFCIQIDKLLTIKALSI